MDTPTITDWITAVAAIVTALFTLALVILAATTWETARDALRASQDANEQARHDSIEQTRPNVFIDVVPGMHGMGAYDIKIFNAGQSSARNLTLDMLAWPEELDDIGQSVETLFRTPRTLPPQCGIRALWRMTGDFTDGTKVAGMPEQATLTVSYTSDDPSHPEYRDEYGVDLRNSGLWPVPTAGPDAPLHLSKSEKSFYKLGQFMVRSIAELGRYK
ncbi:hypothetical protein DEJ38_06490 [Kocuria rosea]|uniref:hypothetical protein n=1 Tax=Kocuria rosea TaxID=1275 RepID=UPI000D65A3F9|nr:hypothetical protein [Kocuria rosea]PWF82341.1 hypothetical protein DEJ38_06490 [Kocuria rosea]